MYYSGGLFMNKIITIGREFGSGGRELGVRLSEKLGFAYYDNEIITEIAKRTSLSEEYVRQVAERKPVAPLPIHVGMSFVHMPDPAFKQSIAVFAEQHKIICEMAEKSDCVIVGRCADYILREENPFRIFVYADQACKLERCMARLADGEKITEKEMKRKMNDIDRGRADYYSFFSDGKWGARETYDLMVNTSHKDMNKVVDAVCDYYNALFAD